MVRNRKEAAKASLMIILIGLALILIVFFAAPSDTPFSKYSVNSPEEASAFLSAIGWESNCAEITVKESILPVEFDQTFLDYNELQKTQSCDLSAYAGKSITVYTVPITNYSTTAETIYATLIVHKNRVIGGDIHSANMDGFMHTLI